MNIKHLQTADLIPYARNARKHDDAQVAQIAGSIKEFGFNNPVLIDKDNGIIAGHGRVLAAQKLGMNTVPIICLDHLSDTQKRAYILADNRLAEKAEWDDEMLKLELDELSEDFDLDSLGFDDYELSDDEEKKTKNESDLTSTLEVIAECEDEEQQKMIYDMLNKKGIICRVVTL